MIVWLVILALLSMFPLLYFVFEMGILQEFMPPLSILLFLLVLGIGYRIYYVSRRGEREKLMARIKELEEQLGK
jgi:hypothetical protein